MDPDRFTFIKELLIALEDVPAADRAAYLDRACGDDAELRAEVESLLGEAAPSIMLTGRLGSKITPVLSSLRHESATPTEVGPYRIVEVLGEGGMGVVYRAEQTVPIRREVALKLIRYGMDSGRIVSRFEAERQTLAMMDHPNIARVFDAGTTLDGRPYFVMELVRGEPVTDFCARENMPLLDRLHLFLQICDGVRHAHQKGVIHRDIKPSNVLVTRSGDAIVPKIIDFGIAKAIGDSGATPGSTIEGQVIGTPEYMSPEQAGILDTGVDARTDVYALGVLLYELVSGKRPYDLRNRTPAEIDRALRTPPKPPTAIGEPSPWLGVPLVRKGHDIDAVALMAIERKPEDRYDSIEQLADDVRCAIEYRPVRARTQTWAYRGSRFIRRHSFAVATAAAFALLLVVSVAAVVRERNRALSSEAQAVAAAGRAQAEATKAKEVSGFLVELFRESDPSRARGANITARELLDRGAQRVGEELSNQDEVRATLMDTIGVVYRLLALYDESEKLATDALATRRRTLGDRHPDVATSLDNLGQLAREQSRFEVAVARHREALEIRRAIGPRSPETAQSLNNLALAFREWGKYDDAEPLAREALDIRLATLPPDHPDVLSVKSSLADLVMSRGNHEEAEKLHREILDTRRRVLPPNHPSIARSLNNVASMLGQTGRLTEAEPLFREALVITRTAHGDSHPDVSALLVSLGSLLHDMARLDEAEPLYREALAIDRKHHGDKHLDVAVDLNNLASLLEDKGQLAEAGRMFEQSLAIRRELQGENSPSVAILLGNLGRLRFTENRLADAERVLRQAVEIRKIAGIAVHPRQTVTLTWLGRVLFHRGDMAQAEQQFRAAIAIERQLAPKGSPGGASALLGLGWLMVRNNRAAEGEPLLRESLEWRKTTLSPGHRGLADAELAMGECLLALSRFDAAEPLLLSGASAIPVVRGPGLYDRQTAHRLLVTLYERWGKPEEAQKFRRPSGRI